MLKFGLYEQIINKLLENELSVCADNIIQTSPIEEGEASKILSKYVAEIVEKGLDNIIDKGGDLHDQISIVNQIVSILMNEIEEQDFKTLVVSERAEQLLAYMSKKNSAFAVNNNVSIIRPDTSISQSSLFTGAIYEPQMFTELKKEIVTCDRIDMLVSFIKWSGLRLIIDELVEFTRRGGKLRIITTSYMGATDIKAVEELRKLPNTKIKVSYDTKRTRLHAKTYVFYRDTGFTTAYVGSSNLSNAAISSGLEWNVKIAQKDLPETIKKIKATFESYWNATEFEVYTEEQRSHLARALKAEKKIDNDANEMYIFDITPYSYQQEILDKLEAEREIRGYYRNLIVAATGTGKTVISAFDYKRFKKNNSDKACRLLFVSHREEILKQSLYTFREILKDKNFGELFVGNYKPDNIDNLFISIQTFNSQDFTACTSEDFYDFIIIDEFHHAAAPTYKKLLNYYKPKILLGLTATPERMDGKNILDYFNNRIAAEIRLPEAIDRKLLSPFQYFGVTDTINLNDLKWSRGGYDKTTLSNLYTLNVAVAHQRAEMVIQSLLYYVTDIRCVRGLGFCVSIEHAKFMADFFNKHNIPSIFLIGSSSEDDRRSAKKKLVSGEIKFLFVVDIYNEGVDIPEVNTILFLRPTESLTVFLQQLGRGLRLAEGKECLTVLDFIGQANKRYNFEDKFKALLSNTTRSLQREIKEGFLSVPKGCYIQLEKQAQKYILENIRASFGARAGLISRIANFSEDTGKDLTIENFVEHYHIDIRSIYSCDNFSRLCVQAGLKDDFVEELEGVLTKAFLRIANIDSRRLIKFLVDLLSGKNLNIGAIEYRMLQMLQFTVWQKPIEECGFTSLLDGVEKIRENPVLCAELIDLLQYKYERIDFIDCPVELGFDCPLDVYCTYTRDQILVALDFLKPSTVREGVKYLPDKNIDIAFITLNKTDKDYSPSTMYNDYSINETMFHWQSQSTTSDCSVTGQRYIRHKENGGHVLLFVRESKTDKISGAASAYTFLGKANYLRHEGSRPMNIIWQLENPIPAKFLKKTNNLIVG